MASDQDLVPHKRALACLGLSRTSVWRALGSDVPNLPTPVVVRRRLFWRQADLEALKQAMLYYEGRCAFERSRQRKKVACASRRRSMSAL